VGSVLESEGNLYVCNAGGSPNVAVFPPGGTTPSLSLQGLTQPTTAAIDTNGDVYVANRGSQPSILVFTQGQATAYRTITDPLIQIPTQVQFDGSRNLYFSDNVTNVSEIPHGSQNAESLGLQGLTNTSGIALDTKSGNIYVSDIGHNPNQVALYKAGSTQPAERLNQSSADELTFAPLGHTGYLFVPDTVSNQVLIYKAGSRNPHLIIGTDLQYLIAAAIKPPGVP